MRRTVMWDAFPLIVIISLVYAATRHEEMQPILRRAARFAVAVGLFMAAIFAVLWFFSDGL